MKDPDQMPSAFFNQLKRQLLLCDYLRKETEIQRRIIGQLKKLLFEDDASNSCVLGHHNCPIDHFKYNFFTAQPQDHSKVAVKTEPKSESITVKPGSPDIKSKDLDMQSFIVKMSRKVDTFTYQNLAKAKFA